MTFHDPDPPDVELVTARLDWKITVTNAAGSAPASLGALFTATAGDFAVRVIGPGNTPGAVNVSTIDLTPSGDNHASLVDSYISGNLTGDLTVQADSGGAGGEINDVLIGGNVTGSITAQAVDGLEIEGGLSGDLTANEVYGLLSVEGDVADTALITFGDIVDGALVFLSFPGTTFEGDVVLGSGIALDGYVEIGGVTTADVTIDGSNGDIGENGWLVLLVGGEADIFSIRDVYGLCMLGLDGGGSTFSGFAEFENLKAAGAVGLMTGTLAGQIQVNGNIEADGGVVIDGVIDETGQITVLGTVEDDGILRARAVLGVGGDMYGLIEVAEDMEGLILVDNTLGENAEIDVDGSLGETGGITIDYDGDDSGEWESGGVVIVGANTYTENTPAARVWETTPCKGDMNNDGYVDYFDIDPYLLALFDRDGFADAFPGLGGFPGLENQNSPMLFHGDFAEACFVLDSFDTDPFVDAIFDPQCCITECDADPCESFGGGGSAEDLADALATSLSPASLDALIGLIQAALPSMTQDRQTLWSDVLQILGYE